jgi:hypothetical protein
MRESYFELLFFWFFGELDTCYDIEDLNLLRHTFETNYRLIELGSDPVPIIQDYWKMTHVWHEYDQTELLFKTGVI